VETKRIEGVINPTANIRARWRYLWLFGVMAVLIAELDGYQRLVG
jgi:hypothetical protein